MYLRTTKRKNKNGTATEYLQLAYNERNLETNTTVARIIHSFVRVDQFNRDHNASAGWAIELLAAKRFKRYLAATKTGKLRLDRAATKEASRYDGKWVFETNDDTISLGTPHSATKV